MSGGRFSLSARQDMSQRRSVQPRAPATQPPPPPSTLWRPALCPLLRSLLSQCQVSGMNFLFLLDLQSKGIKLLEFVRTVYFRFFEICAWKLTQCSVPYFVAVFVSC